MNYKLIKFDKNSSGFVNFYDDFSIYGGGILFDVKRVFYMYDVVRDRGFHAHKETRQFFIAISGSCEIVLKDGKEEKSILLDSPYNGLFVDRMIWNEMHNFSKDCILVVLADTHYDENEYIRDYYEFLRIVKNVTY